MRRIDRAKIVFAHDIFMAAASFVLTLLLRMGDAATSEKSRANE